MTARLRAELRRLTALLLTLAASGLSQAATITLKPVADTTLFEFLPDNNLGGEPTFICGVNASGHPNRALLKFDIAGNIPANAAIEAAALTATVIRPPDGPASSFRLYRVLADWAEGSGLGSGTSGGNIGALAAPGEATWRARFYPDVLWSGPGAVAPADYAATASATQTIAAAGSYTFSSSADLMSDVQNWLTNSANNFGWILICDNELTAFSARRFGSREDPANAPLLEVEYLPLPEISRSELTGNEIHLSFIAHAGHTYFVQSRDTLASGNWITFTNLPALADTQLVVANAPFAGAQRFYRVGVQAVQK